MMDAAARGSGPRPARPGRPATVAGLQADADAALIGGRFGVGYVSSPGAVSGPGAGAVRMAVQAAAQDRWGLCPCPFYWLGLGREVAEEPVPGEPGGGVEGARLFEQVGGAGHDGQAVLAA